MEDKQPWAEEAQNIQNYSTKHEFVRTQESSQDKYNTHYGLYKTQIPPSGQPYGLAGAHSQMENSTMPVSDAIRIHDDEVDVPQRSNQKKPNYNPEIHYSKYASGTSRNYFDLVVLITIIVAAFMVAVHLPKYILEGLNLREQDPTKPDSAGFIACYVVFSLIFWIVLTLLLALPIGKHKYIIHKTKRLLRLSKA